MLLYILEDFENALSYLLNNIYIRFGNKLYRQIVGIPMAKKMCSSCSRFGLFCYERD